MLAIAGRVGIELNLDDIDLGKNVPLLVNCMPSGSYLMEDFCYAGGVPAVLAEISHILRVNIDCMVLPDRFIDQASPTEMYRDAGMSEGDIIARCIELLSKSLGKSDQQVDKINIQSS